MRRLHILVEGQTEEAIARNVFAPFFSSGESHVTSSICPTSRPAGGPAFKGGISNWGKLQPVLRNLLRDSSITVLTTLIDYYGFPKEGQEWPIARTEARASEWSMWKERCPMP